MTPSRALVLFRLATLVALAVSSALLVDYLRAEPAFCAVGSGCDRVRRAGGYLFDVVPIPALGVLAYGGLLALSFFPRARGLLAWSAMAGSLVAIALLAAQGLFIGAFCVLCVIVDSAAIAAGSLGFLARNATDEDDRGRVSPLGWTGLALLALGVPVGLGQVRPSAPVPLDVAALWKPGAINVIEFSDFECPFCRAAHPALEAAKKTAKRPVNFVRKTMPLPRHPHARAASKAWICAAAQGKGDEMADVLYASEDLSLPVLDGLAKAVGCDVEKQRACVADRATDEAVDRDMAFVMRSSFEGLPTVWIDDTRLLGAHELADYVTAIADADTGKKRGAPRWWPLAFAIVIGVGVFGLGLRREA